MKKRILCALIGLLILIASSAMAEGPKWMTIRNLNWVVIDDYHITIPDGMKTAGLNTEGKNDNVYYAEKENADIKIINILTTKNKGIEKKYQTEEEWKNVIDQTIFPALNGMERLTETETHTSNIDELIFARIEGKDADGYYHNVCVVRGKGSVLTIIATGEKPIQGKTIMEQNLYQGDQYGYSEFDYEQTRRYPDKYEGYKAIIEGKVLQVMGSREEGFELRVATDKKEKDQLVIYVPKISMPDYNFLEGDKIKAHAVLYGEEKFETVAGDTVTVPYAGAMGIELKND